VGLLSVVFIYLSMFSLFFILTYYLQFGLHFDAQATSFVFLPLGVGFFLTSLISSRVVDRWGMVVMKIGALITAGCCFLLILLLHIDATHLLHLPYSLTLLVYGLGLGLVTTPLTRVVLNTIPREEAGTGSGLFNTVMYLANSLGVALSSIVFTVALGHSLTNATISNYVSAFSASLMLCGGLSLSAYVCLVFLFNRQNK